MCSLGDEADSRMNDGLSAFGNTMVDAPFAAIRFW